MCQESHIDAKNRYFRYIDISLTSLTKKRFLAYKSRSIFATNDFYSSKRGSFLRSNSVKANRKSVQRKIRSSIERALLSSKDDILKNNFNHCIRGE